MRLRSSQFVFLMLLICSVQIREEYVLHLVVGSVSARSAGVAQLHEASNAATQPGVMLTALADHTVRPVRLDSAARAAHRTPWSMRSPALEAAKQAGFTGYLRA